MNTCGQIESLAYDIDFKTKVSRAALEGMCSDIKHRFAQPIYDALDEAGLTLVSCAIAKPTPALILCLRPISIP